jgi:hypothetical protein
VESEIAGIRVVLCTPARTTTSLVLVEDYNNSTIALQEAINHYPCNRAPVHQ